MAAWADDIGIRPQALAGRLERGWEIDKAVTTKAAKTGRPRSVK